MARGELASHLGRIEKLVREIDHFVSPDRKDASEFRADLAGLLVVAIAASYESCIKEILINFAYKRHVAFGTYTSNNYGRLNSRIAITDLHGYAKLFGDGVHQRFKAGLARRSGVINTRLGQKIEEHYQNILSWRHAFAHSWARNTTVEEVIRTHRFAIRVIYSFDEAFSEELTVARGVTATKTQFPSSGKDGTK